MHPVPECLAAAERRRAFARALRLSGGSAPVEVGPLRDHVLGASSEAPSDRDRDGQDHRNSDGQQ